MKCILVVVDMQLCFSASKNSRTLNACKREIELAIKNKNHIIFLEWEGGEDTRSCLTKLTKGYDKVHSVLKAEDDGSNELKDYFKAHKLPTKAIRVCGANIHQCVYATVRGLSRKYKGTTITVVKDACAAESYHKDSEWLWSSYKPLLKKNVKLLEIID
jgi:nicotinamidase-related amidase